jgi:hypothetical protein
MADANNTPTPEPTSSEATPATTESPDTNVPAASSVPPAVALWKAVSSATTTQGAAVRELVIAQLTEQEIVKRKEAVISVLGKYEEKTKELKKQEKALAKVEYDAEGKVTRTYYDAEGSKALKAIREEIEKISQSLTNFFDKNDTNKLYEFAKK